MVLQEEEEEVEEVTDIWCKYSALFFLKYHKMNNYRIN
jgi:hypothetical protein